MRSFLTPDRIILFLASTLFGMLVNVFSNWVSDVGGWLLTALFAAVPITGIVAVILMARTSHVTVKMSNPIALMNTQRRQRNARQGMIVLVSKYSPIKDPTYTALSGEQRNAILVKRHQQALQEDYSDLHLEQSNLEPLITALTAHQSRLRHCWLIATTGKDGSQDYLPVLIKYLREQKGFAEPQGEQGCHFHCEDRITLDENNETQAVDDTRQLVEEIFKKARSREIGLKDSEIIADITGATRSMQLGMMLACLDGQRDLQYTGAHLDLSVTPPTGQPVPVIYKFEPRFVKTE